MPLRTLCYLCIKNLKIKLLGNNPLLEQLSDLFYSVQQERSRLQQVGKKQRSKDTSFDFGIGKREQK